MNDENRGNIIHEWNKDLRQEIEKQNQVIAELRTKLTALYSDIGKIVYENYKNQPLAEVEMQIQEAQGLEQTIQDCMKQIQTLEEQTKCPNCKTEIRRDMIYCYNCREKLRKDVEEEKRNYIYCSKCGEQLEMNTSFCTKCGEKVKI